jgi:hypothetical protein
MLSVMGKPYAAKGYICEALEIEPGDKHTLVLETKKQGNIFPPQGKNSF